MFKKSKHSVADKIQKRKTQDKPPKNKLGSFFLALSIATSAALAMLLYLGATGIYKVDLFDNNDTRESNYSTSTNQPSSTSPYKSLMEPDENLSLDGKIDLLENPPEVADVPDDIILDASTASTLATHRPVSAMPDGKKPILIIIMDDITTKKQLSQIKETGLKITPSILTPTHMAPYSNLLASSLKHYMIHLPLESGTPRYNNIRGIITTNDSNQEILARVDKVRELFPHGRYINNHIGSVFTSSYPSMKTLYSLLRKKGFVFIDSQTSPKSKVKQIAKEFGDTYISRDVFLDNKATKSSITKQLKQAIRIAKRKGHAIAICHPYAITMNTLKTSKDLLREIELVYVDQYYK